MKKPRILIVDDDASLLSMYQSALSHRGFRVFCARNAEEGLKMIENNHPDLVVADIMMPMIHGLHFINIVKSTPETKDQKMMVLTALDDAGTREQAVKYGAIDYIVKSQTNMADVMSRIAKAVI